MDAIKAEQRCAMYTATSLTFEAGIIFHSIFIGISLGITSDSATVHALTVALCFHQVAFNSKMLGCCACRGPARRPHAHPVQACCRNSAAVADALPRVSLPWRLALHGA